MAIALNELAEGKVLRLSGEINLSLAVKLKALLVEALDSASPLVVDVGDAIEIDLACLQLLVAAERTFAQRQIRFAVEDSAAGLWAASVRAAGFPEPAGGTA